MMTFRFLQKTLVLQPAIQKMPEAYDYDLTDVSLKFSHGSLISN